MGFVQPGATMRRRRSDGASLRASKLLKRRKLSAPKKSSTISPPLRQPRPVYRLPLSHLELLPIELLQNIFLLSQNLSLPLASPALCQLLTGRYLQIQATLSAASSTPAYLTEVLSRRFFTSEFLHYIEERYGWLSLHGAYLPPKLLKAPFLPAKVHFLDELLLRGAVVDKADMETSLEGIKQAVEMKQVDAVEMLVTKLKVKPFPGLLGFGIEVGFPVESLQMLVGPGDLESSRTWMAAVEAKEHDYQTQVLNKLLDLGNPPPEVISGICTKVNRAACT